MGGKSIHAEERKCGKQQKQNPASIADGLLRDIARCQRAADHRQRRGYNVAQHRATKNTCNHTIKTTIRSKTAVVIILT